MRIIQIAHKPQRRGAEVFAWQLARGLRGLGHNVCTIYLYPCSDASPLPLAASDVQLAGKETHHLERTLGVHPTLLRQLGTAVRKFNPDIVQANGGRTVKYAAFAKRATRSVTWKLVYKNIDDPAYWVRDSLRLHYYRHLVMTQVDGVVGVSQVTLTNVHRLYKLDVPSQVILNGRDPNDLSYTQQEFDAIQCLRTGPDVPLLLFVGSLRPQKRPDRFLRIVKHVQDSYGPVDAWIVGDGPLKNEVILQAAELGLTDYVHCFGYQENVAPFMAVCDILVQSSDSEGTPGVVIEAAMLGKPAVATNVGGTVGCIRDGETGILVKAGDEAGLTDAATRLVKDDVLRRNMGFEARRWVSQHFTIDHVVNQYLDFYLEVSRGTGSKPIHPKNVNG